MIARGRGFYALVSLAVIVLDQITKRIVDRTLPLHDDVPLIPGFLSLQYVRNTGAAFGVLSNADLPHQGIILSIVSIVALGAIALYAWRLPLAHRLPQTALALVMGGAIGNLIDRARFGYVVDFVLMYWRNHRWPNYNVADSAITIGICLLVLDVLRPSARGAHEAETDIAASTASRTE